MLRAIIISLLGSIAVVAVVFGLSYLLAVDEAQYDELYFNEFSVRR